MRFSSAGLYTFSLTLDGVALGERTVDVRPSVSRTHQKAAIA
jgi:hypothetical protein